MKGSPIGVDFGTSNSTVGLGDSRGARLVALEDGRSTLPSALFFPFDGAAPSFGRAAIDAYVGGESGRFMRALKSILGTSLIEETTRIGRRSLSFVDILAAFFAHLRSRAEIQLGGPVDRAVLGRPVRFIDDNDAADAAAQRSLGEIARAAGFKEVEFQYEPIAAALDYEQGVTAEEIVLIVDIGGGTSDFSIVRVSPERAGRADRRDDVLANAGVHIGGTDFDRLLSLSQVMPQFGHRTPTRDGKRDLPSRYYHDLATWHFINRLYTSQVINELKQVRYEAARRDLVDRLIALIEERRGHALALAVERAKIELTERPNDVIDLTAFHAPEPRVLTRAAFDEAIEASVARVVGAVGELLDLARLKPEAIGHVFVTGGSSSVPLLLANIRALLPSAKFVTGDLFGSVGVGLALEARRKFR